MSSLLRIVASFSLLASAACASGSVGDDGDAQRVDGAPIDTSNTTPDDAAIDGADVDATDIDAAIPPDAMIPIDAAPLPIDAPPCTPSTTQRLANPTLDLTPMGASWVQTLADPMYPLITDEGTLLADTAPYRSWMGGIDNGVDAMEQTVAIPAGTTQLQLRGKYQVRTGETGATVYDRGFVELTNPSGTVLETVLLLTNAATHTAWTQFTFNFATPHANETVKVRFRSTNDISNPTSFYFDTLALDATVTCP